MKTPLLFYILTLPFTMPATAQLALIRQGRDSSGTPESGDWHGAAVALGDFNGDGYDDLATGAPFESFAPSSFPAGAVIVSYATPWGLTWKNALSLSPLDASLSTAENHQMGKALAAGDFNNDGYDDLAVGLPASAVSGQPAAGRVLIFQGSASGLNIAASVIHQGMVGAAVESGDAFGASLAAGKLEGDNYDDLVIGATGENDGRGAVFVIRGGALGPNLAQHQVLLGADLGLANQPGDQFGYAVLIANVMGFPAGELVVGAPFAELTQGVPSSGLVYISTSTSSTVSTTNPLVVSPINAGDTLWLNGRFGSSLAAGDLWGDGSTLDLAIGAPGSHAGGRVYVVRGSPLGISWPLTLTQPATWGPDDAGDEYGYALAAGDHDSDGDDDLAVGSPGQDVVLAFTNDSGSIHIHSGGPAGPAVVSTNWLDFDLGDEVTGEGRLGYALAAGRTSASTNRSFVAGAPRKSGDTGQVFDIAPWRQVMRLLCRTALSADCENNIVYALRPFDKVKIASTTKTMTALLACEATQRPANDPLHFGLQETYTIESWMFDAFPLSSSCSIFGFPPAPVTLLPQTHTMEDLLYACIFPSGNDACYAIADAITGEIDTWGDSLTSAPEFVAMMNARAAQLGMNDTFFTNPAGIDPGDPYSTAYDMWLLSRAAMANPLFKTVAGATDYAIERVVAGAEAGMFSKVNTNLSYNWLKDLKKIDSRMTGIKPGGTPGAKTTGVAAGRYDAAGNKLAFANGFRWMDSAYGKQKLVALTQLGLSFCNTDLDPVEGLSGPISQQTWQVNDGLPEGIQWGNFGNQPDAVPTTHGEWIEIHSVSLPSSSSTLARYPLHLHYRGMWELVAGQSFTVSTGSPGTRGKTVRLRLAMPDNTSPATAPVIFSGSHYPSPQSAVLFGSRDTTLNLSSSAAGDTLTVQNNGQVTAWVMAEIMMQTEVATSPFRLTFQTNRASERSGYTLFEGQPKSPTDPRGPVEIVVQDRASGLRFVPPLELSGLQVQRSGESLPLEEISFSYGRANSGYNLPDFISAIEIQTSDSFDPGKWELLDRIAVRDNAQGTWRGELPAARRRFFRVVGIPTEN
jgi:hypothetical protein